MTYFSADAGVSLATSAVYHEARPESGDDAGSRAFIRIGFVMEYGQVSVSVSVEDARVLAEQLPGLVMAHDAAEHVRIEQAAADKSAASPQAA